MEHKLLFFIFHVLIICYPFITTNAIVGPNTRNAREEEFPAVVALSYIYPGETVPRHVFCSGTFVTIAHILSSYQCFDQIGDSSFYISSGSVDMRNGVTHFPWWWTGYDQWANQLDIELDFADNDVSVIKIVGYAPISTQIGFLAQINPISMMYGLSGNILGYGKNNQNQFPMILLAGYVDIMSNSDCENYLSNIMQMPMHVHNRYICTAVEPFVLLSEGDAGGPLIFEGTIIALNKATCPNQVANISSQRVNIHLTVQNYLAFIREHLHI